MGTYSDLDSNNDLDSEPNLAPAFNSVETGYVQEKNPYDSPMVLLGVLYQLYIQK